MKDHPDRSARLQLIESMFAGQSWQVATAQSNLRVSRTTAYRLVQLARDEEKAASAFLDDRHGHPYKMTEPVQVWLVKLCTRDPQIPKCYREKVRKRGYSDGERINRAHSGLLFLR